MNISVLIRYTFWPVSCQKKDVQSKMYNMNQQLYSPSNAAHMIQIYLVRPFPTYALHNRYLYYHFKNAYNCIYVAFFFCTPSTTLCQDNWYYPKDICMNVDNIYTIIAFMSNQMRRKSSHSYLLGGIRIVFQYNQNTISLLIDNHMTGNFDVQLLFFKFFQISYHL